jgi:protein-tyrosine phosphatase
VWNKLFWKKTPETTAVDLGWLGADMHSHLLPGIDDGSPDVATSIQLIEGLMALGYKKFIATPHVLWDLYPNTPDTITKALGDLRAGLTERGLDVEIGAAAEYYIDDHFQQELKNKAPLLPIKDNLVLVEFSMLTAPLELQEVLFEMQLQNYQPIIAHPERYIYLQQKKSFYDDLRDAGCLFQLNLLALTGYYGREVKGLAEYLLKKGFYSYAGTDLHGQKHLSQLPYLGQSSLYAELRDSGLIKNHLL